MGFLVFKMKQNHEFENLNNKIIKLDYQINLD